MSGRACTKRQYTTKCPFVGTFKPNQAENPSGQGFGALYHPARGPASLNRSRRGGRRLSPPHAVGRSARGARAARWGGFASPRSGEVGARNARSQVGRFRLPTQWGGRRAERAQPGGEVSPPHAVGRSARGARRVGTCIYPRQGLRVSLFRMPDWKALRHQFPLLDRYIRGPRSGSPTGSRSWSGCAPGSAACSTRRRGRRRSRPRCRSP